MLSSLYWVPRGAAKTVPKAADPTEDELAAMRGHVEKLADADGIPEIDDNDSENEDEDDDESGDEDNNANMEIEGAEAKAKEDHDAEVARAKAIAAALGREKRRSSASRGKKGGIDDELAGLDMEHYDDEDAEGPVHLFGNGGLDLVYCGADPYVTLKDTDQDEDEIEDFTIRSSDLLILAARNEDDVSHLEVWVYDDGEDAENAGNMYVHHDIMLSAFPLSMAWMDLHPTKHATMPKGNLVAVGTMEPEIEIWDLDVLDDVEPVAVLGGALNGQAAQDTAGAEEGEGHADAGGGEGESKKKKKKKKPKKKAFKEGSHTDAVLALAWNFELRNVLASGSADNTVKVWDITTQKCDVTLSHHSDKVQAVAWNPTETSVLLTGAFDRTVALGDMRTPSHPPFKWSVTADVECMSWDPHSPFQFVVSTEDGLVKCFDVRSATNGGKAKAATSSGSLYTLAAHDKPACTLAFNPVVPNLLATASTDKTVKLWDVSDHKPNCLASTDLKVGAVFSIAFSKDNPCLLAAGGAKGNVMVWDIMNATPVARKFGVALTSRRPATASPS